LAHALGNSLIPVGTGELVAAVMLGAVLRRHPFRTGLLLMVAPGVVLVGDAGGRSPGRVLGTILFLVLAAGFLGCAAGAGAAWIDGLRRRGGT
jgi:hypothetical protein